MGINKLRVSNGTAVFDEAENRASIKFSIGQTASGTDKYATMSVYNLKKKNLTDDEYEILGLTLAMLAAFRNNTVKGYYNNITKNVVVE